MRPLILHVGMPKTGTTSIQSTLFWNPPKAPFRFITLDSVFGNQVMAAAFTEDFEVSTHYYAAIIPKHRRKRFRDYSKKYLARCLERCARLEQTPVLSAETVWRFTPNDLLNLRAFAERYGFFIRVIGYLRPPLDRIESSFQESTKTGAGRTLLDTISIPLKDQENISKLDSVFERPNVELFPFVPDSFPDKCVVKHFCDSVGIDRSKISVIRENESINLHAVKFLYIWRLGHKNVFYTRMIRVRTRLLLDKLQSLDGPPLRFASDLTGELVEKLKPQILSIEERIGRPLPLTLASRQHDYGIQSPEDLLSISDEALEWLAKASYSNIRSTEDRSALVNQVFERLCRLSYLPNPVHFAGHFLKAIKLQWRRERMIRRLCSQG